MSSRILGSTILRVAFAAIAIYACSATAAAQQGQLHNNNTIRGKVRSSAGSTVNNAIVELRIGGGAMISQTATHSDGDFAFPNLLTGEYEVAVTASGYEAIVQRVRFNSNAMDNVPEILNVEVVVRPKADPLRVEAGTNFAQNVPKEARAAYEKAIAALNDGKFDDGTNLLKQAIGLFSDYFNAYCTLAEVYFRKDQLAEALTSVERARQINEKDAGVYFLFGKIMLKQQKFAVADYAFKEAIKLSPNSAACYFFDGVATLEGALREKGDPERKAGMDSAEKLFERAWDVSDKRLAMVYLQLARIHERRGDKEQAAKDLETYLKADPESKRAAEIRATIDRLRTPQNKPGL